MSSPQQLVLYRNKSLKFFHIGVHDTKNIERGAVGIKQSISKAKYAIRKASEEGVDNTHAFDSGFFCALIVTKFEGWDSTILDLVYNDIEAATDSRDDQIDSLEDKGWVNVGNHHHKTHNHGRVGNRGWGASISVNVPLDRLTKIFNTMTLALDFGDVPPQRILNSIHKAIQCDIISTKGEMMVYILNTLEANANLKLAA